MTSFKTRVLSLAAALAVCAFCACSRPGGSHFGENGIMMSMEDVLARPAELELSGPVKIWVAEKSSEMGVYYVLSGRELLEPAKQAEAALRIVLFKGRAELRVGDTLKVCDAGAYAVVPPGTAWRLKRLGPEPLVLSLLVSPDAVPLIDLLRPLSKSS
ncbi:MAG TPA: hypothetical protein DCZ01_10430 [Elusimicrobia bacterium]|nr:hypothetical protein [Elusimicrobiota bacterium]